MPYSQTMPRSLRSRSTIVVFSARLFPSARSPSARRASSAGVSSRRQVPLIGLASAQPSRSTLRKRSGEELEHGDLAEAQEGGKRRRVDPAQGAIEPQWIGGRPLHGDPVGQADLVGLAREQAPLAGGDVVEVALVGATEAEGDRLAIHADLPRPGIGEGRQRGETTARLVDPPLPRLRAVRLDRAEEVGAALEAVEGDDAVGEDERRVGGRGFMGSVALAVRLQLVPEVTGETAVEVEGQVAGRDSKPARLAPEVVEDRLAEISTSPPRSTRTSPVATS